MTAVRSLAGLERLLRKNFHLPKTTTKAAARITANCAIVIVVAFKVRYLKKRKHRKTESMKKPYQE